MTNTKIAPRFVHIQSGIPNYSGMTIAYVRTESEVYFSYALCSKADNYEKSVGRNVTTATLAKHHDESQSLDNSFFHSFISKEKRFGVLSVETFRSGMRVTDVSKIFADHVIDNLTCMDLKHACVSSILSEFIYGHLFSE